MKKSVLILIIMYVILYPLPNVLSQLIFTCTEPEIVAEGLEMLDLGLGQRGIPKKMDVYAVNNLLHKLFELLKPPSNISRICIHSISTNIQRFILRSNIPIPIKDVYVCYQSFEGYRYELRKAIPISIAYHSVLFERVMYAEYNLTKRPVRSIIKKDLSMQSLCKAEYVFRELPQRKENASPYKSSSLSPVSLISMEYELINLKKLIFQLQAHKVYLRF